MTATTKLQGRIGNNFYQIATCIAYALRNGMDYHIPDYSPHMPDGKNALRVTVNNNEPAGPVIVKEASSTNELRISGIYQPIPHHHTDVCLIGYWQSFKYFDDYRREILTALSLPYKLILNAVSIHVRRGDYLNLPAFEVLPMSYYEKCMCYFKERGYDSFYIFSDDIKWCKENFPGDCVFVDGGSDIGDLTYMSCFEHNIVSNSSYSFVAAWLNRNPDKIVLCPDERYCWFNDNYIPDYYTVMLC